jgi:hypothetical protein
MRPELTSAEIAMSGSYFDYVLLDPRRYGIENTTDKVRRPSAVRLRRDAVCTERIVGHPDSDRLEAGSGSMSMVETPGCRKLTATRRAPR